MALTDEAIDKVKQMILSGQVGPGEKLPREKELAEQLGLSRSSLREAVRALTFIGVLKVRQGDGTYVTSLEPGLLLGATELAIDLLQESTLVELLEVRRLLEPGATAMAAARVGDQELARLRDCLTSLDSASSVEELVEADDEFHAIIAGSAGNSTLFSLVKSLSSRTMRARLWRGLSDNDTLERTKRGHHAIYSAIESRDPEFARAAATAHIFEVESWFRSVRGQGLTEGEVLDDRARQNT